MMTSCRECRALASSEAQACPHCGAPWPAGSGMDPYPMERDIAEIRKEVKRLRQWLVTLPIALIVIAVVAYAVGTIILRASK